uniref:G-protein coupled receptors family 1 profile domain-containing protein n=1 Tax=Plectus sambesii TaxID=2011161 RepID=A0A914WVQ1_9BILA
MAAILRNRTDGRWEQVVAPAAVDSLVFSWILYGVEGCILTVTNFPIVFAVFFYSKLRQQKEFVIVGALALADGIAGFGFLLAAIGRILLVQAGEGFILITRWQCLLSPWVILWAWCQPLTALMLTVVSLDRLIAVSFPLRYYTYTNRYAFALVGCAYGYVFIPFFIAAYRSYQVVVPDVPAYCLTFHGFTAADYVYFQNFLLAGTSSSVILYIPVLIKLKFAMDSNHAIDNSVKFKRLKRATITLGISTFFTFIFYIVPMAFITFKVFKDLTVFYLMLNLNAMVNIFIYFTRFKEIRAGLKSLVMCRRNLNSEAIRNVTNKSRVIPVSQVRVSSIHPRVTAGTNGWTQEEI